MDMGIIADAVRIGFLECHEAMPLVRFREAVLMALPLMRRGRSYVDCRNKGSLTCGR
jgi:hypothetical protein